MKHNWKNYYVFCLRKEDIPAALENARECPSLTQARRKCLVTLAGETRKLGYAIRVYYKNDGTIDYYKIF